MNVGMTGGKDIGGHRLKTTGTEGCLGSLSSMASGPRRPHPPEGGVRAEIH